LKGSEYQTYSDYLINFIKAYQSYGIPVYGISPANEPEFDNFQWSSCRWTAKELGSFIVNNFGPSLQNEGLATKIIFGETAQWSDWGILFGGKRYVRELINNTSNINDYPVIAAGHGYVIPLTSIYTSIVPYDKAMEKGIPVWMTEVSYVQGENEGAKYDINDGLNWAADWHRYLSDASVSAVLYWLGAVPGDNDEGLIFLNTSDWQNYTYPKRYETFGNFSRYIKPNSRRITIDRGTDLPTDFHISSYKKDNEMVIVMVNKTTQHVTTPLNVNGVQGVTSLKRVLTDADNRWAESDVLPENGQYMLDIPAKSTVTFVGTVE